MLHAAKKAARYMERGGAQWGARRHAGARLRRGKVFSRYGRLFNSRSHDAHNSTQTIGAHAETTVRHAARGKQAEAFDSGDASCAPRGGPKDEGPLRQPADLEGAGCAQTRSGLPRIRPRASLRRRSLGARMRRHVLLENMGAVEMDVNLGRRDVGMPENLLDDAQIRTA